MAKTKTYTISLPDGRSVTVTGKVDMVGASGVLRVRPADGPRYTLSPSGWWTLEETDGGQ